MRFLAFLVPIAFLLSAGEARGEALPPSVVYGLLLKVARAPSVVSYDGTLQIVFRRDSRDRTVTLSIQHSPGQADQVRVLPRDYLPPPARKPEGDHWEHGKGPLLFMGLPGMKERLNSDLALLLRNYTFGATDGGRIAGRSTYRLEIDPKYPGRKTKVMWIDNRTGIVLKSEVTRPASHSVVTITFTAITESPTDWTLPSNLTSASPDTYPKPLTDRGIAQNSSPWIGAVESGDLSELERLGSSVRFSLLAPRYVPEGFVIDEVREITPPSDTRSPVVHVLYSDGLSSISLFLQKEDPFWLDRVRRFFFGFGNRGGLFHRERPPDGVTVVQGDRDGTRYVLVSDISGSQISRMASSLAPVTNKE